MCLGEGALVNFATSCSYSVVYFSNFEHSYRAYIGNYNYCCDGHKIADSEVVKKSHNLKEGNKMAQYRQMSRL